MIRLDDVHSIKLIAQAARVEFVPKLHHCIARYSESDMLMGGVLYTDFYGGAVAMHWAGFHPNWISRPLIYLAFDYPFRQLKVKKVLGLTPEWNIKARNTALRFGFKIEYKIDDIFNNLHNLNGMYILSMKKEDCRWLDMPMPFIELAPPERTNNINLPLAHMQAVGVLQ